MSKANSRERLCHVECRRAQSPNAKSHTTFYARFFHKFYIGATRGLARRNLTFRCADFVCHVTARRRMWGRNGGRVYKYYSSDLLSALIMTLALTEIHSECHAGGRGRGWKREAGRSAQMFLTRSGTRKSVKTSRCGVDDTRVWRRELTLLMILISDSVYWARDEHTPL